MVEESLAPGASVAEVARRHEVHTNQLHGWRREVRSRSLSIAAGPCFAPVEITVRDQAVLPPTTAIAEAEPAVMIEVALRNGRLVRFSERIDARRAARLADALDGAER
jgi:transposase